jgi:hypothetical protein
LFSNLKTRIAVDGVVVEEELGVERRNTKVSL